MRKAVTAMIQKFLLSKLIQACEKDWIPDNDTIYGETIFANALPKNYKKLIYAPYKKGRLKNTTTINSAKRSFLSKTPQ